jgi:hypothetical protein
MLLPRDVYMKNASLNIDLYAAAIVHDEKIVITRKATHKNPLR